jgi:uncharacterized protein (TIGR03084 family)
MFQQAADLEQEGVELKDLLERLSPEDWVRQTPFKSWTVDQVVQHLHGADRLATLALCKPAEFAAIKANPRAVDQIMNPAQQGVDLLNAWWSCFSDLCKVLGVSDPGGRVPWFGPDMGVIMFATARQMEIWAHGQDVFDMLGQTRTNTARLKNIVEIGVRTYGWTFSNRGLDKPGPAPYVRLTAPDGSTWEYNEPQDSNMVAGDAAEFCHVVTQGRNIKDVNLVVVGQPAAAWMAIAQCFAGPPEDPPAPGSRLVHFDISS